MRSNTAQSYKGNARQWNPIEIFEHIGLGPEELGNVLPSLVMTEFAYVTGSVGFGLGTVESDIDIVVVCEDRRLPSLLSDAASAHEQSMTLTSKGFKDVDRAPRIHFRYGPNRRLIDIEFHSQARVTFATESVHRVYKSSSSDDRRHTHDAAVFFADLYYGLPIRNRESFDRVHRSIDFSKAFRVIADHHVERAGTAMHQAYDDMTAGAYTSAYLQAEVGVLDTVIAYLAARDLHVANRLWSLDMLALALGRESPVVREAWKLMNAKSSPDHHVARYVREADAFVRTRMADMW